MATAKASLAHEERTAGEPRDSKTHQVTIDDTVAINEDVRIIKLKIADAVNGVEVQTLPLIEQAQIRR